MHDLKLIYICPIHGEVDGIWVEQYVEPDDCIGFHVCSVNGCTSWVEPKQHPEGGLCYRKMSEEEMFWEHLDDDGFENLFGI